MAGSLAGRVSAATTIVTAANFVTVFKTATGGDTLKLSGAFGLVRLQDRSFTKLVTIDASAASFTDTLALARINNVKIVGGKWDIRGGSTYGRAAVAYGGSNIWFDRTNVVGVAGQQGVNLVGTNNAQVSNGVFNGLQVGVALSSVNGGVATRNKITHAVSDGIDIADSHNVTASFNSCSVGNPGVGVHPDCIQLWSVAGRPIQSDVVVTRNTASGPTQGFTSFSTGGGALRVQITSNTVATSFPQGIACYDCWDSTIANNKLSTIAGSAHLTNLNIIGGDRNIVLNNVIAPYKPPRSSNEAVDGTDDGSNSNDDATVDPLSDGRDAPDFAWVDPANAPGFDPAPAGFTPDNEPTTFGDDGEADALAAAGSAAAVPEPAAWLMLIVGFGAVGAARRRIRTVAA